jgi:hypothetical protein
MQDIAQLLIKNVVKNTAVKDGISSVKMLTYTMILSTVGEILG